MPITVRMEHHIWCNFFNEPVEYCKQCKRLWEKYPYETDEEAAELQQKYFPGVQRRHQ